MQPFAAATAQLSGSIKAAGQTVVSEVDSLSANWDPARRQSAEVTREKFSQLWARHQKLGDALVEYSTSLSSIAAAGEQGEKSAKAVAASFKQLTDTIGVAFPPSKAGEVAINLGSYLYGKFAQDRAAKTLGESMNRLQPVINETAAILSASLKDLESALDAIRDQGDQNIEDEVVEGDKGKVSGLRGRLKRLLARRAALLVALDSGGGRRDSLRAELVAGSDAAKEAELSRLTKLTSDIAGELAVVEGAIQAEAASLKPFDERKVADRERISAALALVRVVGGGLNDWALAHSRLAAAALERKTPPVEDLIQTALEIRDLVKTVRSGHIR